jgi:hypothetical protein
VFTKADFGGKLKIIHEDLVAAGIVRNRTDQHNQIKAGRLRRPHKQGRNKQSPAFWYVDEILEDLNRERLEMEADSIAA